VPGSAQDFTSGEGDGVKSQKSKLQFKNKKLPGGRRDNKDYDRSGLSRARLIRTGEKETDGWFETGHYDEFCKDGPCRRKALF
jgi:hypothetical protein